MALPAADPEWALGTGQATVQAMEEDLGDQEDRREIKDTEDLRPMPVATGVAREATTKVATAMDSPSRDSRMPRHLLRTLDEVTMRW